MQNERLPAVAGQFYADDPNKLRDDILHYLPKQINSTARAVIAPHAGYMYSGPIAGYSFKALKNSETYLLLGPVHHMANSQFAVSLLNWKTPLGTAEIDAELANSLIKNTAIEHDESAHLHEHSLEVQVPFLQVVNPNFKIVPVAVSSGSDFKKTAAKLGEQIGNIIKDSDRKIGIVTSSDFSHFISEENAKEIDLSAIELITKLDADGFYDYVSRMDASICGYAPITLMLNILKIIGIKKGELLKYDTSASISGDKSNVVGYASIKFDEE
ncbi:AmmeMemoRadiSam system protein B [Candidatus Undinarchaeota archaeon]